MFNTHVLGQDQKRVTWSYFHSPFKFIENIYLFIWRRT